MNYRELRDQLNALTAEQLEQPALAYNEDYTMRIHKVDIIQEDMVNPSGEGAEPASLYCLGCDDPECESSDSSAHGESIIAKKGDVFIELDY